MQRIPGFRRVGDPGLEPGTSSLSGKPFVPSSPPNSHLIPANRRDGASGRGLEGTGGYNLVAPSWPHDRRSRAWCRMARKRTSCRRYGQARTLGRRAAARLHDRVDRGEPRRVVELVDHVPVGLQGQAGTVTELPRDMVNRAPLMQKQRREAVAQVVRDRAGEADAGQQARERPLAPVVPGRLGPVACRRDPGRSAGRREGDRPPS